jgi:hypothetical protein
MDDDHGYSLPTDPQSIPLLSDVEHEGDVDVAKKRDKAWLPKWFLVLIILLSMVIFAAVVVAVIVVAKLPKRHSSSRL